jgi:hypothetical protein
METISNGIHNPGALAFDGSGNLYVANENGACGGNSRYGTITVYAPGSTSAFLTISQGISGPLALAFGP